MSQLSPLRLATWNVNGLGNPIKRKKILTQIKSKKIEVVFLQECHLTLAEAEKLCKGWVGQVFCNPGTSKSKGVITLVSKHIQLKCLNQIKDNTGRILIVLAEIYGVVVSLANIYAPNLDDASFFLELETKLHMAGDYDIIIGGDFNLLLDPLLDYSGGTISRTSKALLMLQRICKTLGLVDIWRILHPKERDYTYYSAAHKIYSRIDFFLVTKSFVPLVLDCTVGNIIISDHAWVCLEITYQLKKKSSSRWRLNTSLLQESETVEWLRLEIIL